MMAFWLVWLFFFVADLFAIGYTGLWFGLTEQHPGTAITKTVTWVILVPWVTVVIPFFGCLAWVFWPVFWIVRSSGRLNKEFRSVVLRAYDSPAHKK